MKGFRGLPDMNSSVPMPDVSAPKYIDNCETCSHRDVCKMKEYREKLQADIMEKKGSADYSQFDAHIRCKCYELRSCRIVK